MTGLDTLYRQPPKAEVHRHHVGSAPPRIVTELAVGHEGCTRRGTTRGRSPGAAQLHFLPSGWKQIRLA